MGNVLETHFKKTRGNHVEGDLVTESKDWFHTLLQDDFDETRRHFFECHYEVQEAIVEIFDGERFFEEDDGHVDAV